MVKKLPAMQETQVRSLGQEDPLEKTMATHSSILGWRIPWAEESDGLQFMGSQREGHDSETLCFSFFYFWLSFINQDGHGSYSLAITKIAARKEQEESGLNNTASKKDNHNTHFFQTKKFQSQNNA